MILKDCVISKKGNQNFPREGKWWLEGWDEGKMVFSL